MPALQIPYFSQIAPGAQKYQNDCGPTCVAMLLKAYGKLGNETPDTLYARVQTTDKYVSVIGLITLLEQFGVTATSRNDIDLATVRSLLDSNTPLIACINYGTFIQRGVPVEVKFYGAHFVVVIGYEGDYLYFLDPLRRENGQIKVLATIFMAAWSDAVKQGNPPQSGIIPPALPSPVRYLLLAFDDKAQLADTLFAFVAKKNVVANDLPDLAGVGALMNLTNREAKTLFGKLTELFTEYQPLHVQPMSERIILTNQQMINHFFTAFGSSAWGKIVACKLEYMAQDKQTRAAQYAGPNVFDLPLSDADKTKLTEALNRGLA